MAFTIYKKSNTVFYSIPSECSEIDIGDYTVISNGIIYATAATEALENIFLIFNAVYQNDDRIHLFSVGDLMKVNENYYCLYSVGWKKIDIGNENNLSIKR